VSSRGRDRMLKRAFDLAIVIPSLVLLAPVLLGCAWLVRIALGRPVIFRQVRAGLHGQPFTLMKFRTMTEARDASGHLLPDAERLTRVGRLLRATSLDELPELFNVLRGDMSLVGPRPLHVHYLGRYTREQMSRHELLPGITGWVQVSGRNALTWEEKFRYDLWYVEHRSLALDVKILFLTIWAMLRRHGISQEGHATMPEFMGSPAPSDAAPSAASAGTKNPPL
jgi:sugar transferase EpsL